MGGKSLQKDGSNGRKKLTERWLERAEKAYRKMARTGEKSLQKNSSNGRKKHTETLATQAKFLIDL